MVEASNEQNPVLVEIREAVVALDELIKNPDLLKTMTETEIKEILMKVLPYRGQQEAAVVAATMSPWEISWNDNPSASWNSIVYKARMANKMMQLLHATRTKYDEFYPNRATN